MDFYKTRAKELADAQFERYTNSPQKELFFDEFENGITGLVACYLEASRLYSTSQN